MSAKPKLLQIRSEIQDEVEPTADASLEQWQAWTVRAVRAAESADRSGAKCVTGSCWSDRRICRSVLSADPAATS